MKRSLFLALSIAGTTALLCSCSKKPVDKLPNNEREVIIPCSGTEYFSNETAFRANAIGESRDQMISKKKALSNARAQLAASINTLVKGVTDNYVNSREFNNKEEVEERFETLNREVVEQKLQGLRTICEKQTQTEAGTYKTYIAIELSADELVSAYNERLMEDERLKIDYDYEKFKQTFEEEMSKLR